jgi:UDP-N-acetylmuramoylalanine--D-glutamate ligase
MSPHIAVVLLIEPEHLNVHLDMDDYVNAKSHIRMHQTAIDSCVYHPTNPYSRQIAKKSEQGKTYRYGIIDDGAVYERGGLFYQGEQAICSINNLQLIGDHNIDNACAAITAARLYEPTITIDSIEKGLKNFSGLPHRLQFIKTVNSVRYYDDSIATTPSSAIAALRAIDGEKVIILGGSFKGSDFTELARELLRQRSKAILIGDEAESIARASEAVGFTDYEIHTNPTMQMIVERAAQLAVAGGSVLLSPASASFGLFKNYEDRGNQFAAAVDSL